MDLELIKQKISEDKAKTTSSYKRYPVRFLFMELNSRTQDDIQELVKSSNGELLELSDFIMKKDDGWLTKSRFMQVINSNVSTYKDTYVVGFSEMIRFYSRKEIESTVLSLFDIENSNAMDDNTSSRRIYFICFSMMDNVAKVLQNCFPRKELIDPFINPEFEVTDGSKEICFVSEDYSDEIKKNKITTSVEWIGLWRHSNILDFKEPIWCCSKSLYEWHKKASPDNAFRIDVINNTKEYLSKVLGYEVEFEYSSNESMYWMNLAHEFEKMTGDKSVQAMVAKTLGVDPTLTSSLVGKMVTSENTFTKWIIKNYVHSYLSDSFLERVFQHLSTNTVRDLLITVWIQGYRISNPGMLAERLDIIKELNKYAGIFTPEEEICGEILGGISSELCVSLSAEDSKIDMSLTAVCEKTGNSLENMKNRMFSYYSKIFKPAYTGISNVEKEFLINLYSNGVLDRDELKIMYPSLYAYLYGAEESVSKDKGEYKIYLENYRQSKIHNADTPYLDEYYSSGCASADNLYESYYSIDKQDILVQKLDNENTDVYVIDGVGAEYIPLLIYLVKSNGYEIESCDYAMAHLPSITDVNKAYLESIHFKKWIVDFDRDVVHGEIYRTTTNMRKAMDVLGRIVKDIIEESYGRRIIITADHGATARAKWTDTKKKYNFDGADHEGRCCKIKSKVEYENTVDYIVFEDELNSETTYVISINETSLLNRPKYEDHGGATLEEILVPVMAIIPAKMKTTVSYKVFDEKLQVSGLDKVVKFTIMPDPEIVYLIDGDGVKHEFVKKDGMYQAEISSGREQEIVVCVDDKEIKFKTINAAKKNMEGDDGFDD